MKNHHTLSLLQTFVIVAEEKNLSRTSDILHITPSAVSHQMKRLEQQLSVKLIERKSKGIELTKAGSQLYERVKKGMSLINSGLTEVSTSTLTPFVIAAIPSFVDLVLLPNIDSLKAHFTNQAIEIIALDKIADFNNSHIDCHIHFGDGQYSGARAKHICDEWVYPAGPASLSLESSEIEQLLTSYPLIEYRGNVEDQPGAPNWRQWMSQRGYSLSQYTVSLIMNNVAMTMEAAKQMQGLFLARHQLCSKHLGPSLVALTEDKTKTAFSYFLAATEDAWQDEKLLKLYAWLLTVTEPNR
ncbi:LysR family transcriptional regulator [Vibrio sonorensis]|uniref:LysR family transcriptional regulator n=1 Tax=Vibrio sonorensis TaxID=1004316 RepID=UPI0008D93987|nr:LysR family transcriptional regulator [Vibrio sonorensis]